MKLRRVTGGLALLFAILVAQGTALAHQRDYIFNQSYYTTRKGEFEVELYNDFNMPNTEKSNTFNSLHQVELEYGITSHLQLAYYEVIKWNRAKDWQRDALKIEAKYRFLESGELPVDIALYGEYKNPNGRQDKASDEIEGKLILSRDFGLWNVTANLITERKINEHEDLQWEYTLGVSYPLNSKVRLGLELKETLGDQGEFGIHRKEHELQLMPVIAASFTPHSRILFGPAVGLTHAANDLQLKSIVEIEF
ncbi:MAG: hypothetical protein HY211_05775 [Candidatus Omnitrophica bacterium]|nr:hypothetical protein [Candidatus Omnitrophota bacterium]